MLVIGVAPLFAPTVGGFIANHTGWRPVLGLLVLAGAGVLIAVWRSLPETRRELCDSAAQARAEVEAAPIVPERARRVLRTFAGYRELVRDPRFLALAAMPGLALATIMSYVSTSVFVLQDGFGLTGTGFAVFFALNGTALIGGTQLNAALVERFGSPRLLRVGVAGAFVFGVALTVSLLSGTDRLVLFAAPLYLLLLSLGLIMPNAVCSPSSPTATARERPPPSSRPCSPGWAGSSASSSACSAATRTPWRSSSSAPS